MLKRLVGVVLAIIAVGAAGAGAYWYTTVEKRHSQVASNPTPPIAVSTAVASVGTAVDRATAVGALYPRAEVAITPAAPGHIVELPQPEGARIAVNDVLLLLDASTERAALADAEASLQLQQSKLTRARTLADRGFAAQAQLDESVAAVAAARASVARAQAALDHRKLTAPFAGQIGKIGYSIGAWVGPSDVVMTLRDTEVLRVDFRVPVATGVRVKLGAPFTATVQGLIDKQQVVEGRVSFIDTKVDIASLGLDLRGEIKNEDGSLKPGMFVRIELTLEERPGAVMIPESALVYELAGRYVYRVVDGKAERVAVEVAAIDAGRAEIRSGVAAGDKVITDGRFQVRHGSEVRIVDGRTAADAAL